MTLDDRISKIYSLFIELEKTSGRNDKELLLTRTRLEDNQLNEDITYALEMLDGQHKLGYTYYVASWMIKICYDNASSLEKYLEPLFEPKKLNDFSYATVNMACSAISSGHKDLILPLVNREWRLGIGKSQLEKTIVSPMLAKKFDPDKIPASCSGYSITEKLDGNRCIAYHDGEKWQYVSRSGKTLKVDFDMSKLNPKYTYDGEILLSSQVHDSKSQEAFNRLSGTVNSKYKSKDTLVYVVFDIILKLTYNARRSILNKFEETSNVKILPVLRRCEYADELAEAAQQLLAEITYLGGEGIMINVGERYYEQKRTDALLKLKEIQTMDMKVTALYMGTGKHEGRIGSLECCCIGENERDYECRVGTGLSDMQRSHWLNNPQEIIGKIVEVAYFSISQSESVRGTKKYSLRFPRLKRVRQDKTETSVY